MLSTCLTDIQNILNTLFAHIFNILTRAALPIKVNDGGNKGKDNSV